LNCMKQTSSHPPHLKHSSLSAGLAASPSR